MVGNAGMHGRAKPLHRLGMALVLLLAMSAALACVADAQVVALHGSSYGVTPAPAALQPTAGATLSAGSSLATASSAQAYSGAEPPATYHGGGLMLSSTLYLIFWDPEGRFSPSYTAPIVQFAEDLQADQGLTTDEFSLTELYANAKEEHITGKVTLGGEALDTTPYPAPDKADGCQAVGCLTDPQIQSEIMSQIYEHGWPSGSSAALQTQYLLYTPSHVSVCLGSGSCTTSFPKGFCAYHGEISRGIRIEDAATYSVLPYVPICDPGEAPLGVDGTLDSEMHEIVESATDPQPGSGYVDENGREIADKCVYPAVSRFPAVFGTILGGSFSEGTAYNELIGGHAYYTQAIWSNARGCVARIGPTPSFATPGNDYVDQPTSFNASGSYDLSGPMATYEWNYGDGSPTETTTSPTITHVYLKTGAYLVSLTLSDESGPTNASTQTQQVTIGTEPPPPEPSPETGNSPGSESPSGEPSGTTSTNPAPSSTGPEPPAPNKPAGLTRRQKLARALKACHRFEKQKRRQRCISAAKKRFGPKRKHRKR
jgi:PKD domain-containing protein